MSGFFVVDAAFFRRVAPRLMWHRVQKSSVDLLATSREPVRIGEEPYEFRKRHWGESKLDTRVEAEYLYLLLDNRFREEFCRQDLRYSRWSDRLAWSFTSGFLPCFITAIKLGLSRPKRWRAHFFAMTFELLLLNNVLTFRDKRLRGWHVLTGLLTFYAACAAGALINLSVADSLFRSHVVWWFAAICGVAVSSVWNYGVNTVFTWRREKEQS